MSEVKLPTNVPNLSGTQKATTKNKVKKSAKKGAKTGAKTPAASKASEQQTTPLFATFPQLAAGDIDQKMLVDILKKLEVDLFGSELSSQTSVIKTDQDVIKDLSKSNQKKLADMLKSVEKKKSSGLIGKIFGWIGAALGIILGTVLAIVSFGTGATAAGVLIAVSVALAVTLIILSTTGGMDKMMNALAKPIAQMFEDFGMDPKKRSKQLKLLRKF